MIRDRESAAIAALSKALRAGVAIVAGATLVSGCDKAPAPELVSSAKFGVFFGGQIEERRDIPFELDSSKQTQGFRIRFAGPLASDVEVAWTIDMPRSGAAPRLARPKAARTQEPHRTSIVGKATARAGLSTFDQVTAFEPGDPLGLWNARVVVRGKVVIDRPFEVYDRNEREKASAGDAGTR